MIAWRLTMFAAVAIGLCQSAGAQYSTVAGPFNNASHSYFERLGFGFSGTIGNNAFFNTGGVNNALPPFGGFNPANDANFGFGIQGSGFTLSGNIAAQSGSDASFSSITPSVTVPNGGTGTIFSGQQRPFVMGFTPVVGGRGVGAPIIGGLPDPRMFQAPQPYYTSPLVDRMLRMQNELKSASSRAPAPRDDKPSDAPAPRRATSSAERGDLSLSELRAQRAAADAAKDAELDAILEVALAHEADNRPGQALIYYQRAYVRADGELKRQLQAKIDTLKQQRR